MHYEPSKPIEMEIVAPIAPSKVKEFFHLPENMYFTDSCAREKVMVMGGVELNLLYPVESELSALGFRPTSTGGVCTPILVIKPTMFLRVTNSSPKLTELKRLTSVLTYLCRVNELDSSFFRLYIRKGTAKAKVYRSLEKSSLLGWMPWTPTVPNSLFTDYPSIPSWMLSDSEVYKAQVEYGREPDPDEDDEKHSLDPMEWEGYSRWITES